MKKILVFAVLASLGIVATAQEENIRFGAKAGVNFASIGGDETDDLDGRTSFHLGAIVEIPISEKFAFAPELLYSSQGAKFDDFEFDSTSGEEFSTENTIRLNYINVPLMAKFYAAEGFSLQAGPQIGFLTSAKEKVEGEGIDAEEDIDEFYKSIDLGLNFGAGYQLPAGIFFDARYNLGLSDLADDREDGDDNRISNNVFQISVGYKF
ncbi:PorT family protein [Aquimarina sp. U1-2]|uniref:porin family protein n=1 Tax=Aquimarina sp. U1-2 TaxID=2823141 RepID=UPI001AEC8BEC|nr:porin family protein [Aquimarina sp. U1-2]MBP2833533.1 PorT family protein [Aquimarina sp. U1-2]